MPGGIGGGGGPPKKTCPRCGRETVDEVANRITLPTIVLGFVTAGLCSRALKGPKDGPPEALLVALIVVLAAIGHLAIRRYGVARGWRRRCDPCGHSWPFEALPLIDSRIAVRESHARLEADLLGKGFARVDSAEDFARLEGTVDGREASVVFSERPSLGIDNHVRLALACRGETPDDPWRLDRALDGAPRCGLKTPIAFRDEELIVFAASTQVTAADALAVLHLLALTASALELKHLRLTEHGTGRCAYCHEDLDGRGPLPGPPPLRGGGIAGDGALVACAACGTVLHEACWTELGRCPVLGCGSKAHARARDRE